MSESDDTQPKITLAMADNELRRRILELLEASSVDVQILSPGDDVWDSVSSEDADIVLVRRSQLPDGEELAESLGRDEAPGVIVLSDGKDVTDRARLMAAGATGVVPVSDSNRIVADTVERLAAAEVDGGVDGPEVRGNEAEPRLSDFMSRSPRMRQFLSLVERVADSDATVLITGETGVGKERLARAIHAESRRSDGPFVTVNCGALPEHLLESELFGHMAGAFTGADRDRRGRFEVASGGTIFLDEIGEMPSHLQVRLLTVLQRHEVQAVGAEQPVTVDVRVMAATNRDPQAEVDAGRLREDLYYRLNVVSLEIPSLRERHEDLPDLIGRFIRYFRTTTTESPVHAIDSAALEALLEHDWPGNVRELINVVERAMLVCQDKRIGIADLPQSLVGAISSSAHSRQSEVIDEEWAGLPLREVRKRAVARVERQYLELLLVQHEGNVGETASAAGITARALYDKMKKYGLKKESFRTEGSGA